MPTMQHRPAIMRQHLKTLVVISSLEDIMFAFHPMIMEVALDESSLARENSPHPQLLDRG